MTQPPGKHQPLRIPTTKAESFYHVLRVLYKDSTLSSNAIHWKGDSQQGWAYSSCSIKENKLSDAKCPSRIFCWHSSLLKVNSQFSILPATCTLHELHKIKNRDLDSLLQGKERGQTFERKGKSNLTDMFLESFVLRQWYQIESKQYREIKANIGTNDLCSNSYASSCNYATWFISPISLQMKVSRNTKHSYDNVFQGHTERN